MGRPRASFGYPGLIALIAAALFAGCGGPDSDDGGGQTHPASSDGFQTEQAEIAIGSGTPSGRLDGVYRARQPGLAMRLELRDGVFRLSRMSAVTVCPDGDRTVQHFFLANTAHIRVNPETGRFNTGGDLGNGATMVGTAYRNHIAGRFGVVGGEASFMCHTGTADHPWLPFTATRSR